MDRLDAVLADLGKSMGMEDLAFTGDECRFLIEDHVVDVIADRKRGRLVLTSLLADMPGGDPTEILRALLDLNTSPALGGPALGVPDGSEAIILTDQLAAAELSPEWLRSRLTAFLAAIDTARSLMAEPSAQGSADAGSPVEDASSMMRV